MRILFVCMGNICRSPTAEGVMRKLLADEGGGLDVEIDSAGTHAYHVGEPPDRRATLAAQRRGIDLSTQKARRICDADFEQFDYVLAMDSDNYDTLMEHCPVERRHVVRRFLEFAGEDVESLDVPDPYYGGSGGFEYVLDLVEVAARGLLKELRRR